MIRYVFVVLLIALTAIVGILAEELTYTPQAHSAHTTSFYFEAQNHTLQYVANNKTTVVHNVINATYQNGTLMYYTNGYSPSSGFKYLAPTLFVAIGGFLWLRKEDTADKEEVERHEL